MQAIALSRDMFKSFMMKKGVTPENVETFKKVAIISINNVDEDGYTPYFPKDKSNVKVTYFDDVTEDIVVPSLNGSGDNITVKAMTLDQAKELYAFIKDNKHKEIFIVHCTAGISRSGAVITFLNDYFGGNWNELMRNNPQIQPNYHVYKLLHDIWYEDQK